jgi:cell division protein FtsI (penicillin-binding protein 3)
VTRRNAPLDEQAPSRAREASIVPVGTQGGPSDLPDLRGLSAREVVRVLTKMGLTARLHGSGVVTAQMPMPGAPIDPGTSCELWLERHPVALASFAAER